MYKLIIAGIGVLAVALLAIGCGGGGSDEATVQVSKAEFYKQARAICAKTQDTLQTELAAENIAAVYDEAPAQLEHEAEELEAISGPEKVEKEVGPLIANVLKASKLIAQEGEAAANAPSIRAYKEEANALGLSKC